MIIIEGYLNIERPDITGCIVKNSALIPELKKMLDPNNMLFNNLIVDKFSNMVVGKLLSFEECKCGDNNAIKIKAEIPDILLQNNNYNQFSFGGHFTFSKMDVYDGNINGIIEGVTCLVITLVEELDHTDYKLKSMGGDEFSIGSIGIPSQHPPPMTGDNK